MPGPFLHSFAKPTRESFISIVRGEGSGWVVAPHDPDALAAAIVTSIRDDASRSWFEAAMARIAEERSPVNAGARLRAVYEEVAGSPQ